MLFPVQIITTQGDIAQCHCDAIVNAANNALADGTGVNGAIQRAAGPELLVYCQNLGGCSTGAAVLTPGFKLPAKYIIHTVGPVWQGGGHGEPELLASCYKSCLEIASKHSDIKSLAFPAISTGVFGFPSDQAARIAVQAAQAATRQNTNLETIVFVCFDAATLKLYQVLLKS